VGDPFGLCCCEIDLEFAPDIDTTPRTPAGVCRFAQARALSYVVALLGEQNGKIDAVRSAWCAATDRAIALVAANRVSMMLVHGPQCDVNARNRSPQGHADRHGRRPLSTMRSQTRQ
jgi:hypothetical protein